MSIYERAVKEVAFIMAIKQFQEGQDEELAIQQVMICLEEKLRQEFEKAKKRLGEKSEVYK